MFDLFSNVNLYARLCTGFSVEANEEYCSDRRIVESNRGFLQKQRKFFIVHFVPTCSSKTVKMVHIARSIIELGYRIRMEKERKKKVIFIFCPDFFSFLFLVLSLFLPSHPNISNFCTKKKKNKLFHEA